MTKTSISVAIPAFNEEENIRSVVREAKNAVSKLTSDYEIVLVDDGSIDRTGQIIDRLSKKDRHIKVFHHTKNKGFTGAMKTAVYGARKDLIFLAPADGQFNFRQLRKFVKAIKGVDMAIAYRTDTEKNFYRRLSSWAIYFLYKILFNVPYREISTVFLWRRKVIDSIKIMSADRSAMFLYEFFYKAHLKKYKFVEVPIRWLQRRTGKPKGRGLKTIVKTLEGMFKLRLQTI